VHDFDREGHRSKRDRRGGQESECRRRCALSAFDGTSVQAGRGVDNCVGGGPPLGFHVDVGDNWFIADSLKARFVGKIGQSARTEPIY